VASANGIVGTPNFISAVKKGKFAVSLNAKSNGHFWDNFEDLFIK